MRGSPQDALLPVRHRGRVRVEDSPPPLQLRFGDAHDVLHALECADRLRWSGRRHDLIGVAVDGWKYA